MTKKKNKPLRVIRKSCVTGKAVWVSHRTEYRAVWRSYKTACKCEIERTKNLAEMAARLKGGVLKFLNDCLAHLPIDVPMTTEQQAAARQMLYMAEYNPYTKSEFYEHIVEERRRREEDRKMWRMVHERKKSGKVTK